jgi:2-phosphoglycerate kinase
MIYLIGGPPKCGKTTLAKALSNKLQIPWVSSDTLHVIAAAYIDKYAAEKYDSLFPHKKSKGQNNDETYSNYTPEQITDNYITQGKTSYPAIDMFSICEITDGHDYIIEGYHVTPECAADLVQKYGAKNFQVIFLTKFDTDKFLKDIHKSTTKNDWILAKTHKSETFAKIAQMVSLYSQYFDSEAKKFDFPVLNMDNNFEGEIEDYIS